MKLDYTRKYMTNEYVVVTLIAAIISGVLATAITLFVNYKIEQLKMKRALVDDVFGYRFQLTNGCSNDKSEICRALNRIPIIFNGDKNVLIAYDKFHDVVTTPQFSRTGSGKIDDALITLYKEMCKAAKIEVGNWNDSKIMRVLNVS